MDFIGYQQIFQDIINDPNPASPYDNPDYLNYTKLNWARQHRWLKSGILNEVLAGIIERITHPQFWTIITEPWCGDASHSIPFIHRLSELNPLIKVDYQLRDAEPFLINQYLTNGSKSIPKLIIADQDNNELAVWGPRPAGCQALYDQLLKDHVPMEEKKIALQQWYNADKGVSLQLELTAIFSRLLV
ncbi:thioredoxin family protein [Mucilaginibacter jinjuensis]|uniref:Thioredoxin family protein n=1 Tax=Mucilaginibacter jinjuensis TaxID=1176721 RepID=A0ABY7TEU2_9SPHI|nr:thioredoxin family protein [Mucilaginibacter jinjuensis]WCT14831.1 thioredoxin family protein [Mucilaginibacter jinjuensis]